MFDISVRRHTRVAAVGLMAAAALSFAALSVDGIAELLSERAQNDAVESARAHASVLNDRLAAAEQALRQVGPMVATGALGASTSGALVVPYFKSVSWHGTDGSRLQIHGPSMPAPPVASSLGEPQRAEDETLLLAASPASASDLVLARHRLGAKEGLLLAHLDPGHLWKAADRNTNGAGHHTCVLLDMQAQVFCTGASLSQAARGELVRRRTAMSGPVDWASDGQSQLGGYARVSAQGPGQADLTVVTFVPESELRSATMAFAWRLAPWYLLCLFLIGLGVRAFFGAHGRPGARGQAAAAQAGKRQASAQQDHEGQQPRLNALTEIDRAILSHAHLDRVIDLVLEAATRVTGCDLAAVTVIDRKDKHLTRSIIRTSECRSVVCGKMDTDEMEDLAREQDGLLVQASAARQFLQPVVQQGAQTLLVLPVFVDANLAAMLTVAFFAGGRPESTERALTRELADRLGVVLTAAAREQDLYQQANFDTVTSLPNQRLLRERLEQEIARAERERREFALMYLDLDQFRKVNARVGHVGGDIVLEQAARRLRHCLRQEDVIARFSGDEFVILLPALTASAHAARVAEKLIAVLSETFVIAAGEEHHLGASIGISVFPQDGQTADKLMRNASFAMYRAKAGGRGQFAFFDERMNIRALENATLERDLRNAVTNNQLTLAYQPQVDLRSGKIIGAEALVRWNHPQRGFIPPGVFIAIAEQSNLIEAVGKFVREAACAQYRDWQARGVPLPRIAVNVSSREVRRSDFTEQIRALLHKHGLRPFSLELEITESLLMESTEDVLAILRGLHAMGVHLAIDDFGTGYSSLAYLKSLPFNVIKIDRSFVKDVGTGDGSDGVVSAILGVARSLGKDVIAEGVETDKQRSFLMSEGCEAAQGYLWSRPVPAGEFENLLRNWVAVPQQATVIRLAPRLASA